MQPNEMVSNPSPSPVNDVIRQAIHRAEYFFPGEPTISNVFERIRSGGASVDDLEGLLRIAVAVAREVKSQPFVPPYDSDLDQILKSRGWHSLRDEQPENHIFDMWTWPPTAHLWSPTVIHHEGRQLRVFYAIAPFPARSPELTYATPEDLLKQIGFIEAWH
jgi:hypothetical protein